MPLPPPRLRSTFALLALLGAAGLQGCASLPPWGGETLHVYTTPTETSGTNENPDAHVELAAPVIENYRRLHPGVRVRMQVVPEEQLEDQMRVNRRRGLGPDLLLVRAPVAISLWRRGLIDPLPRQPALRDALASINASDLARIRDRGEMVALPVAEEVTLACFDRRRVPSSPQTLQGLLALAASGQSVGISADPVGIWWTAGALGAARAMALLITDHPLPAGHDLGADRRAIAAWLGWLRQAALQSRVDIGSDSTDLVNALQRGRLSWIPCYSLNLMRLQNSMGSRLGVAALPNGPDGVASPFTSLRVWAFGTDSSPNQRRLAQELAVFTVSPKQQRELTLISQSVMPVNRFVFVPVADSGRLAAMAAAQQQFRSLGNLMAAPFSADRVRQMLPPIEQVIYEVMLGVLTPETGAQRILELRQQR